MERVRLSCADDAMNNGMVLFALSMQDRWVAAGVFPGKRKGFFVEIGAHDGIQGRLSVIDSWPSILPSTTHPCLTEEPGPQ